MNTPKTLNTESYLDVFERLARTGDWANVPDGTHTRLKEIRTQTLRTPLTAVIFHLIGRDVALDADSRLEAVQEEFLMPVYQLQQIIDAEDGHNGYSGFNHGLHHRIQEIARLCKPA